VASPAYQISLKSTSWFRSYYWGTHRQTGDLISLLSFLESRMKIKFGNSDLKLEIENSLRLGLGLHLVRGPSLGGAGLYWVRGGARLG
jgi:hypothetical protein